MPVIKQSALDVEIDEIIADDPRPKPKKAASWLRTLRDSFAMDKSACGSCGKCGTRRPVKDDGQC